MKELKIVHVTTVDTGGAYRAVERIKKSMELYGQNSYILVRNSVKSGTVVEEYCNTPFKLFLSRAKNFCNLLFAQKEITRDLLGSDITKNELIKEADIIIIHWINSFLSYKSLDKLFKLDKQVIFFMHDMWLFTGGCHYNVFGERYCDRYKQKCGCCPLIAGKEIDNSFKNFRNKVELFHDKSFTVVGPSNWIVDSAKESKVLFGKEVLYLPNCYDASVYYPQKRKHELRSKWKISDNKTVLLFGTSRGADENENKGISYLLAALQGLNNDEYMLVIFGESKEDYFDELNLECKRVGYISDEECMSEIYNLADVFISPSKHESFGFTICEAMACGIPVVAFDVSGAREQIQHQENGYLAKLFDANDIVKGIDYCREHNKRLSNNASLSAQQYSLQIVGKEWIQLINGLTEV